MAIRIGVDPEFSVGPATGSWHGLATAVGLLVGLGVAVFAAKRRRVIDVDTLMTAVLVMIPAGVVGARLYYALQADRAAFTEPWRLVSETKGFAFYGALAGGLAAFVFVLRRRRTRVGPYLDALALGFVPAMAVGRVGDLLIGEHLGARATVPWGVVYSSPEVRVPVPGVAYHSGALYEILVVMLLTPVTIAAWRRGLRPGEIFWMVLALYSVGRFFVFFWVSDVPVVALGLRNAQWSSLALALAAVVGWRVGRMYRGTGRVISLGR